MTQEQATTEIVAQTATKQITALDLLESKRKELETLAKESEGLKVKGIDDKEGFALVHAQEQKLVKARVYLEKTRKEYTAQFDQKKKDAIALENELIAIISPAEEALKAEKARIAELKEQVRLEAERKAKEKLNHRVAELANVNATHDLFDLEMMEESDFLLLLEEKETAYKAEQEKIAKEAEEKEKYEKERAEFEAKKAQEEADMKAEREKMEAEKKAIQDEKDKMAREAELKKAQEEAAEKARIETEARIKREQEETEAKRIAEEKAKAEQEAKEKAELEAQHKFKDWLSKNGVTAENKADYEVRNENGAKVLWKRVSTYQA